MGKKVMLKGRADGIEVFIHPEADFGEAVEEIQRVFSDGGDFFSNSKINLILSGKALDDMQKAIVSHRIWSSIGEGANISCEKRPEVEKTDFHRGILRSGQKLESLGNMVILGDVNPGAQISAAGNIVVLGVLRGVAHAGCSGNREAVVAALKMKPSQLRIADVYARAPEHEDGTAHLPEIASILDDKIIIEKI